MDHAVAPAIEFDVNTPTARVFKYKKPGDDQAFGKHVTRLARTDRMIANLQVLREGGENNLHSHSHLDGFWMVLGGRARFYGDKNVLIADLGPMEGVLIPRNFKYWFEAVGARHSSCSKSSRLIFRWATTNPCLRTEPISLRKPRH